jgi:hypothetical protein
MSNYKLTVYTEEKCPPCDDLGTYPSASAASNNWQFEEVTLVRNPNPGIGWESTPTGSFYGTPWFHLQNLDDNSTVDSFYGGNKNRLDIMLAK